MYGYKVIRFFVKLKLMILLYFRRIKLEILFCEFKEMIVCLK